MQLQHRVRLAVSASLASIAVLAATASAQTPPGMITSFEPAGPTEVTYPAGYVTGTLLLQDNWGSPSRSPRVQTAAEIADELTAAGLNPANPVRTGDQALLVAKIDTITETSATGGGYLVRNTLVGLETETKVTADFWLRPLTSGLGADPAGTPAGNDKTIGERQGNIFFGLMDSQSGSAERRVAAVRFGVDTVGADPYTNVVERHIDYGTNVTGVWAKSGVLWQADTWYNFRFDMDFTTKTYDFFINGDKANAAPIQFYQTDAIDAGKFFVSRGTNQAGAILDDVRIQATDEFPAVNADFDADGDVDGEDFLKWQRGVGITTGAMLADGDANADGAVNGADLSAWKNSFPGAVAAVTAIPEPATAIIASLALFALIAVGRQSRSV